MSGLIDVEVYGPNGTKVYQQVYDNQAFAAGQTRTYQPTWTVPTTAAAGTYTVKIGVFGAGDWDPLYAWNTAAASFSVSTMTPTSTSQAATTPTITTTPVPPPPTATVKPHGPRPR
jgi:hypothetical protein